MTYVNETYIVYYVLYCVSSLVIVNNKNMTKTVQIFEVLASFQGFMFAAFESSHFIKVMMNLFFAVVTFEL